MSFNSRFAGLFIIPDGETSTPAVREGPTQQEQFYGWLNSLADTASEQGDEPLDPVLAQDEDSEVEEDFEQAEGNLPHSEISSAALDARSLLAVDISIDIWAIRCRVCQVPLSSMRPVY